MNTTQLVIAFFITLISTVLFVYPIKKFAVRFGFLDHPAERKIHKKATPRLGGLAIFLGVAIGLLYLRPSIPDFLPIIGGAFVIMIVGLLDDKYQIRPIIKLTGQLAATGIVISAGIVIDKLTLPILGTIEFNSFFAIFITVIWIVGVTNAINLIDGLDGLASGVTTIGLISILIMAISDAQFAVIYLATVLIAGNIGFLFHNFYPAKIYMGDTGSMFLGYSIAVISTLGLFKNVTLFSFIIPIIILAIPIFDTLFAIVRRIINGDNIMLPDKKHIHYQLLAAGFSHRTTVLIMYGFAALFGTIAILFSRVSTGITFLLTLALLVLLQIFAELVGVIGKGKTPLLKMMKKTYHKVKLNAKL
ncbi:UDP-GlcNAc:undecaprenyl-phosphate GlcNAc-1-phosphate transferase [Natronobacillus azotifigens]|uniref:MraY family glycosyltransferase n=1 Tax=Natronobacillus azotifigens TaxID=472978 RepID=A0A9J6RET3_9BACI|nr:MraY family glycosyltransferase [Natronobacillus azotifigens]MCZ0703681.1 MraY family glycosyltransferase [Natronobacillus azotifigens]